VVPSYQPGVRLTDLASALPDYAIAAIREALPAFDRQIRGFAMPDAVLTGVETRTSSPLRITRGDDCQSVNVKGLYPAGEGAGYAGGILSAGVDGIRVAEAVTREFRPIPPATEVRAGRSSDRCRSPNAHPARSKKRSNRPWPGGSERAETGLADALQHRRP
jgi:hypothetical protein